MRRETGLAVVLLFLTCLWAAPTSGGYRELRDALAQYQPPGYLFRDEAKTAAKGSVAREGDDTFTAEKNRLLALKSHWEKALQAPVKETAFYQPNPRVLAALQATATDRSAAQDALRPRFSLAVLEVLVWLRHPGVKAAEKRARAVLEQFGQVTAVDDILRQYTAFTEGIMTGVGPMKGKEPVATTFPFPGVVALKGQIVAQDVLAAREDLEMARRHAISAARQSHWRLWFAHQAKTVIARTVALLKDLESVASVRYEAGKTSFQDVVRIQIKRQLLEEEMRTLQEKQRNAESEIRDMLDLPPDVEVGMPQVSLDASKLPALETLYDMALARRQELRRLRTRIDKMARMIEMAETMILPSLSLGFSLYKDEAIAQVGSMSKRPSFATSTTASTGAGLPAQPWFGAADAYLREIRQNRQALNEELKAAEAATLTLVRKKWFALDQARREKLLYQQQVSPLSQAALDVSTSGYESGSVSFADVIASYTLWLDAHLMLANRQSAYGSSLAELEQAVGRSFSQHR